MRETSKATLLNAAALLLLLPSPALASFNNLSQSFIRHEIVVAQVATGIYALVILIALAFNVFRSRTALHVSLVFSAIASLLARQAVVGWACYLQANPPPPYPVQRASRAALEASYREALMLFIALLAFAWCSPMIQYFVLRSKAKRGETGHDNRTGETAPGSLRDP